jgi:hypothetical protein
VGRGGADRPVLIPLYAATSFLASALLFVLEPLLVKGLLPVLGGGSAVWTTAVAFFQLALLVGYLYAHLGPRWLGARRHAAVHVALLAAAALELPLAGPAGWVPPDAHPALWLFGRLALTIGPTFALLASSAPLVQRWLAETDHPHARDPYFLYAASNAGSLIALAAYPALLEPFLGLGVQRRVWTLGLAGAVVLLAASAAAMWRLAREQPAGERRGSDETQSAPQSDRRNRPPTAGEGGSGAERRWTRLRWLALSAVPSSLLLSVTSYMTTDVVALPLLWVLPLALYLATFVLAFGRRPIPPRLALRAQPFLLLPVAAEMFLRTDAAALALVPLHALGFAVTALVCHQALAASRPPAERATEFYLVLAVGGALGGLFNVFVAPLVFRGLYEYPIGLAAAALLRPPPAPGAGNGAPGTSWRDLGWPAGLAGILLLSVPGIRAAEARLGARAGLAALVLVLSVAGTAIYAFRSRPRRFGLALAALMAAGATYQKGGSRVLYSARSFYGAHKVLFDPPTVHRLAHGNTTHGAQDLSPTRRREPLTYYHRTGPIGGVLAAWQGRPERRRVGVVGLGAGSLAAYAAPGERWTFFEIDPVVVDIARDRGLFTFLADAPAAVDVRLGDARLSLGRVSDGELGILVLDAFTSDAVPAHLLTREALALDLRKLAPGGVIAVHLSNRYLDLEPVVAGGAAALGAVGLVRFDSPTEAEARTGKTASLWMVLARSTADLAPLAGDRRWRRPRIDGHSGWTDDASDLWRALRLTGL